MGTLRAVRIDIDWNSDMPIFAAEAYLRTHSDDYGWLGAVDNAGRLRGILPYTVVHNHGFRFVRFRVETMPVGDELTVCEEKMFLESVVKYFRSIKADMIVPGPSTAIFRCYPDGAVAAPYGTYVVDLRQPEDVLWKNVHRNNRKSIKQAMRKGVAFRHGLEYTEKAYELIVQTLSRTKKHFMSLAAFQRLINSVRDNVRIFIAEYEGVVHGCAINFFSQHTAYSMYAGSSALPMSGATKLMHWEAMKLSRNSNVARYDFAGARIDPEKGSKQQRLVSYKRELGGRLVQGYMWKYPLKPMKSAIYGMVVHFTRGGDIVDQEHHKLAGVMKSNGDREPFLNERLRTPANREATHQLTQPEDCDRG